MQQHHLVAARIDWLLTPASSRIILERLPYYVRMEGGKLVALHPVSGATHARQQSLGGLLVALYGRRLAIKIAAMATADAATA